MWDSVKILINQFESHRELVLLMLLVASSFLLIFKRSRLLGLGITTFLVCLLANHWSGYLLVIAILLLFTIEKCDSKTMDDLLKLLHAYSGGAKYEPTTQSEKAVETMTNLLAVEESNSRSAAQQDSSHYKDTLDRFKRAQILEQQAIQYLARIYPKLQSSVKVTSQSGKIFVLDGVVQSLDKDIIIEINCYLSGYGPNHAMITGMYEKVKAYSEALNKQTKFIWMWVTTSKENCQSLEKQRARVKNIFEDIDFELQIVDEENL